MADMTSIINEIKGLEQYIKTMRTVYEQKGLREDLDNLLMHINNLKAWVGIDVEAGENTLPTQRVSVSLLGLDDPYPLIDVVRRLASATDYLLKVKDYDRCNYEELNQCVRRAVEIITILESNER